MWKCIKLCHQAKVFVIYLLLVMFKSFLLLTLIPVHLAGLLYFYLKKGTSDKKALLKWTSWPAIHFLSWINEYMHDLLCHCEFTHAYTCFLIIHAYFACVWRCVNFVLCNRSFMHCLFVNNVAVCVAPCFLSCSHLQCLTAQAYNVWANFMKIDNFYEWILTD